jgi:hypothetical protein
LREVRFRRIFLDYNEPLRCADRGLAAIDRYRYHEGSRYHMLSSKSFVTDLPVYDETNGRLRRERSIRARCELGCAKINR